MEIAGKDRSQCFSVRTLMQGYFSGGAGYVLTKSAVDKFVGVVGDSSKCRQDGRGAEDVEMGKCLANAGVAAGDSRDELGRDTFMPFV